MRRFLALIIQKRYQLFAGGRVAFARLTGTSEDFSYLAQEAPGLYLFLGVTPGDQDPLKAAPNHNPNFFVDERALVVGTRTMALMTAAFLTGRLRTLQSKRNQKWRDSRPAA